jgi:signal transduction histidine kinase
MESRSKQHLARSDDPQSIRAALEELAERTDGAAFLSALMEFLQEQMSSDRREDPAGRTFLQLMSKASAHELTQQSLHEVRSLALVIMQGARSARHLADEILRGLNPGSGANVHAVADLYEVLDDLILASERSATVSRNGLTIRSNDAEAAHADLPSVVDLSLRLVRRTTNIPIVATPAPRATVRPPSGPVLQVLLNLLRNAKDAVHGQADPRIELTSWASTTMAFVRVTDNGPGLEPEQSEQLFQLFRSTKESGTGIGLVVCKKLVEGWGGSLDVESEPGRGASFTFGIPLA